jgi:hypothetical protein
MNSDKNIVPKDSERKRQPKRGRDARLEERIRGILSGIKAPLPAVLSPGGQHPDEFNASDPSPSFRKTSQIESPAHSPPPSLPESRPSLCQTQRKDREVQSPVPSRSVSRDTKLADTLKAFEIHEGLTQQLDRYGTLLQKAKKHQYSVRPSTYERVRKEYTERQSSLRKAREEQGALLQKELQGFLQEKIRLEELCERLEDRMEEITFRVTAGEFTEEAVHSERAKLKQDLLNHRTNLEQISEILSRSIQIGLLQETEGPENG